MLRSSPIACWAAPMRALHDHPLLGADEIRTALADNDLADQIERIRITPQTMSVDEFSKLWTTFQVGYRISAAYHVSVVLIDSTRPARTPLPVLTRGAKDTGAVAQPDLIPPSRTLTDVSVTCSRRFGKPARCWGTISHQRSESRWRRTSSAAVSHPRLPDPLRLPAPSSATATAIAVNLPNQPAEFRRAASTRFAISVIRPNGTA